MKKLSFLFIISIVFISFSSCKNTSEKINIAMEIFDNSLDSLITVETFNSRNFTILVGDTLKNNPKQIEHTCYLIMDNDSMLIDANSFMYQFENNELIISASEDILGRKYVHKNIYFEDQIDNTLIQKMRNKYANTDTIILGKLIKYDKESRIVKEVRSDIWQETDRITGVKKRKPYRILTVNRYDDERKSYSVSRKEYFDKPYNVDSLQMTTTKSFEVAYPTGSGYDSDYEYTFDEFGNWIIKRQIRDDIIGRAVYYRKYTY